MTGRINFVVTNDLVEGGMPVNVDHQHVQGNFMRLELLQQLFEFLVAVGPVARPPGAEGKSWRQRDLACDPSEVMKGAFVIVPVTEEIPVLPLPCGTQHHPGPRALLTRTKAEVGRIKERARAVVHKCPAATRDQAGLQFHSASGSIKRTRGAQKIAGVFGPRFPYNFFPVKAERNRKVVGGELAVGIAGIVDQRQCTGLQHHSVAGSDLPRESGNRKHAIHEGERCMIFKLPVIRPLQADELRSKNREPRRAG